jgi:hypothetical protein
VRAGVEVDVSHGETDELGGTQPVRAASMSIVRSRRPVQVETSLR